MSGEISANAGDYAAAALFTRSMKQEGPKCQPHPIHKLSHGEKLHFIEIWKYETLIQYFNISTLVEE